MSRATQRAQELIRRLRAEHEDADRVSPARARADGARLWREYFRPYRRRLLAIYGVIVVWSAWPFCLALTWRFLFDGVLMVGQTAAAPLETRLRRIWLFAGLNVGLWIAGSVCSWLFNWLSVTTSQTLVFALKKQLHEKLQALHIGFYERQPTGRIVSRVMDDVETIRGIVANQLATLFGATAKLLIGLGVIGWLNWKLALGVLAVVPFYAWAFRVFRPRMSRAGEALRQLNSAMYARATERIAAVKVVLAFARERGERRALAHLVHQYIRVRMESMAANQGLSFNATLISAGATAGVLYGGGLQAQSGAMSAGDIMAFVTALGSILEPINQLTTLMLELQSLWVVIRRVFALLDEPVAVAPGAIRLRGMTGKISLDHVTFIYPGQPRPALHDFTLHVQPGERIAVMGPSGAGKSTLFQLMMRFYDPQQGVVRVGGVDLREALPGSVRRHVCMIQQEPVILSGTLADNILYGRLDATPALIVKAARQAELHDFIRSLPAGYETEVGEKGITLSGGQKQRLALATALLTDPEVLLLDDTTSALDAETEARIRETLHHTLKGRTSLIITQRIATARDCDRILVLEAGRIAQEGVHATLLEQAGFYRRIAIQQGWVLPHAAARTASKSGGQGAESKERGAGSVG